MIMKMAWRNLWRNKRRTIITLVSIAFGFLLSVTFVSIGDGSYANMIDSAVKMGSGHVTIEPVGYREKPALDLVIKDTDKLVKQLETVEGVKDTAIRIVGQAMVATAYDSAGGGFIAIDPEKENDSFFFFKHLKSGKPFDSSTKNKIIIGQKMADQLEVKVGKKLVLTATNKKGEVVSGLYRVAAIFETGVMETDKFMVVLPIDSVRKLLGYDKNDATQVAVYIDEQKKSAKMARFLEEYARPFGAVSLPWSKVLTELAGAIQMDSASNYVFQCFLFLLIGAGILNTVLMSVLERIREFGVMVAIGMTPSRLWRLIMAENLVLAILGLLFGGLISLPVYYYFHVYGLDLSSFMNESMNVSGVMFDPVIKAQLYADRVFSIFGGVFLLIMVTGLYPAFVATKTRPVDTLKQN